MTHHLIFTLVILFWSIFQLLSVNPKCLLANYRSFLWFALPSPTEQAAVTAYSLVSVSELQQFISPSEQLQVLLGLPH